MSKIIIFVIVLFALVGIASAKTLTEAKYLGWNNNLNTANMQITINTDEIGNLVYVEDYYSTDSSGQPKFFSSSRYVVNGKNNFQIQRPDDNNRQTYHLVEKFIEKNGKIIYRTMVDLLKK